MKIKNIMGILALMMVAQGLQAATMSVTNNGGVKVVAYAIWKGGQSKVVGIAPGATVTINSWVNPISAIKWQSWDHYMKEGSEHTYFRAPVQVSTTTLGEPFAILNNGKYSYNKKSLTAILSKDVV